MNGQLYVIATPIGNLEDITLRAIRILQEIDGIAAEDTRHTRRLTNHLGLHKSMISLHKYNEKEKIEYLRDKLAAGENWAIVSDAGTPGICDPGAPVIEALRKEGFQVIPVPGPSALATAISVAGIQESRFLFEGFLPPKGTERKNRISYLQTVDQVVILYESPHRLQKTLIDLASIWSDRMITIARELTKIHEEVITCSFDQAIEMYADPKGEFVLIIHAPEKKEEVRVETTEILSLVHIYMNQGMSRKQACVAVAKAFSMRTNDIYSISLQNK